MSFLDKKPLQIVPLFPTYEHIDDLVAQFEDSYKKCCGAVLGDYGEQSQQIYEDTYVHMNQTHSLLSYLNEKYPIQEKFDIKKMQDKMYFIQTSKVKWDDLK